MDILKNLHTCKQKSYRTTPLFNLKQHLRQHQTRLKKYLLTREYYYPEPYQCTLCDFKSDLKVNVYHHNKTVHRESEVSCGEHKFYEEGRCDQCNFKTFSRLILLAHHNSNCHKNYSQRETGDDKTTKTETEMEDHFLGEHARDGDTRWFHCEYCSHKTMREDMLKLHLVAMKHVRDEETPWFSCEQCSFKSKSTVILKSHVTDTHGRPEGAGSFSCETCSYNSTWKNNLDLHVIKKYTKFNDRFSFSCVHCSHSASRNKDVLISHVFSKHSKH